MLEFLAEPKLVEAVSRGEFDDDRLIPEDLRVAYRILKNAGFLPPEVQDLNQIGSKAVRKLALLRTRIEVRYYEKAVAKLSR